jgi:methylglyoxal/glyoxal reductase
LSRKKAQNSQDRFVKAAEELEFPGSWHKPQMPGYGTFPYPFAKGVIHYGETARAAQPYIERALQLGYRHLDTAFTYRNQDLVGAAVKALGVCRDRVFVTSKLHSNNNNYRQAKQKLREAIELIWGNPKDDEQENGSDHGYLDAFLIHYPGTGNPIEAWKGICECREEGLVRHPGVSNFEVRHLEKLKETGAGRVELNQIEFHPLIYIEQKLLVEFCQSLGMAIEGYSPFAEGAVFKEPAVDEIAAAHDTTAARVVLKWSMQHGVRPIVGSRSEAHLAENVRKYDFQLTEDEMNRIDHLGEPLGRSVRVALKWDWNPKKAGMGGPRPGLAARLKDKVQKALRLVRQAG